jgi:hypothetical protein
MNISDEKKVEVLIAALKERYESLHKIRDRVQSSGIWILGILFAASGWFLQDDRGLGLSKKVTFAAAALFAFLVFRYSFLADLRKGFKNQQIAAASIEEKLGLYEEGKYAQKGTVYPLSWKDSGTKSGDGKFFNTIYLLLWIGILFLSGSIFLSGYSPDFHSFQEKLSGINYCKKIR